MDKGFPLGKGGRMNRVFAFAAFAAFVALAPGTASAAMEDSWAEYDFERNYVSAQGVCVLPQGGGDMRRLGGGVVRYGYYAGDFLAVELSAFCTENEPGASLKGLWHWWGYEKTDPFFTFGAAGFAGGDAGPAVGVGMFRHFDDNWSLRLDSGFMMGLESRSEAVFSLACGIQYSF